MRISITKLSNTPR